MALRGEEVTYDSLNAVATISKELYISLFSRILWTQRKLAYTELRARIRANKGKVDPLDQAEVKALIISKTKEIRANVCKRKGIEPSECMVVLQQCYFKYLSDPEFTGAINRVRGRHTFIIGRIIDGELIPEIEHLDINNSSDEALDGINEEIFAKLSR
eukprot:TRINITY_DN5516_c0_g3_i10.p1 TRINITY_DN5516_c0_g3~~TRINITY_DN5516_c0_g3_i10.p1  ORF type:complete len:159 (-),score=48.80 TRINITY_DN5516_c0_g3_i10:90-566(-)